MNFKPKLVYIVLTAVIVSFGLSLLIGCSKEPEIRIITPTVRPDTNLVQSGPGLEFNIRNRTGVTLHYQIKWTDHSEWKSHSLETGFMKNHRLNAENVPESRPKIRFDYIGGDQSVTYRAYTLETVLSSEKDSDVAPTYFFRFDSPNELDIRKVIVSTQKRRSVTPEPTPPRYISVKPPVKLSHVASVKWLRNNGYSVKTNNQTYIIKGQHRSSETNLNISVGATVIGLTVYDKFSMSVGSMNIIDGKISITINRERTVKAVN